MSGGTKGGGEVLMSALNLFPNSVKTVRDAKEAKDYLDLLSVYAQMTINESILSHFMTGQITLNDSNDIPADYPIAGGNILHITYNVADGPDETEIDAWFRIVSIKNVVIAESKQAYTLQFISEDGWNNMHTVLNSSFSGEPSDIILKIHQNNLYNAGKKIAVDKTIGGLKFICPNWKPSQAITWITHKAISADTDNPGFFFYETFRGFRFMSTDTLLNKDKNLVITDVMGDVASERTDGSTVKKGYLYKIPGIPVTGSDGKPKSGMVGSETLQNVDDFRVLERGTIGKDLIEGNLASRNITHDIFHKSYSVEEYNYFNDFNKTQRLGARTHYETPSEPLNTNLSIMISPKHSRIHSNKKGDVGSRTLYSDDYVLMRKQILKQISDEVINNFEAPGSSIIESGRLLEFNYPAVRKTEDNADVYQSKYSGHYLIRDVIHLFTPVANTTTAYKVDMNIVKDGWNA